MPSSPNLDSRGFTLLELLVAMAILSVVAVTALNNNSAMISTTSHLRDRTIAHWVGMNKAAELRLAGQPVSGPGKEGIAVMAGRRWLWKATGRETPDPDIQVINIEVRSEEAPAAAPLASLTMYHGKPAGYRIN